MLLKQDALVGNRGGLSPECVLHIPLRVLMGRFLGITVKRVACRCLDRNVEEPCEMLTALGVRPYVQLLLKSGCKFMCRHIYN